MGGVGAVALYFTLAQIRTERAGRSLNFGSKERGWHPAFLFWILDSGAGVREFRRMKPEGIRKHFLIVFFVALALYVASFSWIEHKRNWKGPWVVTFSLGSSNVPTVLVNQKTMRLRDVKLVFEGATAILSNGPETLVFDKPRRAPPYPAPYGEVVFFDTTFLPGSVTFRLFGNQVELLPRVLLVNQREIPWKSGAVISIPAKGGTIGGGGGSTQNKSGK